MSKDLKKVSVSDEDNVNATSKRKRTSSFGQEQYIIENIKENEISFCNGKDFIGKNIPVVSSNREESQWIKSVEKVVKSVVSIRFSHVNLYKNSTNMFFIEN